MLPRSFGRLFKSFWQYRAEQVGVSVQTFNARRGAAIYEANKQFLKHIQEQKFQDEVDELLDTKNYAALEKYSVDELGFYVWNRIHHLNKEEIEILVKMPVRYHRFAWLNQIMKIWWDSEFYDMMGNLKPLKSVEDKAYHNLMFKIRELKWKNLDREIVGETQTKPALK